VLFSSRDRLLVQGRSLFIGGISERARLFIKGRCLGVGLALYVVTLSFQCIRCRVLGILSRSDRPVLRLSNSLIWAASRVWLALRRGCGLVLIFAGFLIWPIARRKCREDSKTAKGPA